VCIETLAVSTSDEVETVEDVYEPYFVQVGFAPAPRGRIATWLVDEHLGIPYLGGSESPGLWDISPGYRHSRAANALATYTYKGMMRNKPPRCHISMFAVLSVWHLELRFPTPRRTHFNSLPRLSVTKCATRAISLQTGQHTCPPPSRR
jgi:hypothetical protein